MTHHCPVCGGAETHSEGAYRNTSPELQGLEKCHCDACGLVHVRPMPSADLWDRYNASYFERAHSGATEAPRARLFRSALAKIRARQVHAAALARGLAPPRAVLEVGAGYGEFAAAWRGLVPDSAYAAVDTDEAARRILEAGGIDVFPSIADVSPDRDLLVLSHVLEHTRAPAEFLSACLKHLAPGALVFIDVPCLDYRYKSGDEPHLLFFDKAPLEQLLTNVGLRKVEVGYWGEPHARLIAQRDRPVPLQRLANGFGRLRARFSAGAPFLDPTERAVVGPFQADSQQPGPARWLRAFAVR